MKVLHIVVLATLMSAAPLFSQEKTLLGKDDFHYGGFGALEMKLGAFNKESALILGARGAWLVNHVFGLGGGLYGTITKHELDTLNLSMFYLGLTLEVVHNWDELIHLNGLLLIGGGDLTFERKDRDRNDYDRENFDRDSFFMREPSLYLELNVTIFFRINLGVSYRWMSLVDNPYGVTANDVNDFSGGVVLKFGDF